MDGLAHEGVLLADIAAEDGHGADAKAQGEEGLIHGGHHGGTGDLGEIRHQVEGETFGGAGEGDAAHGEHHHQKEQRHHHILGHALQAALEVEAQHEEAHKHHNGHIEHIDAGV